MTPSISAVSKFATFARGCTVSLCVICYATGFGSEQDNAKAWQEIYAKRQGTSSARLTWKVETLRAENPLPAGKREKFIQQMIQSGLEQKLSREQAEQEAVGTLAFIEAKGGVHGEDYLACAYSGEKVRVDKTVVLTQAGKRYPEGKGTRTTEFSDGKNACRFQDIRQNLGGEVSLNVPGAYAMTIQSNLVAELLCNIPITTRLTAKEVKDSQDRQILFSRVVNESPTIEFTDTIFVNRSTGCPTKVVRDLNARSGHGRTVFELNVTGTKVVGDKTIPSVVVRTDFSGNGKVAATTTYTLDSSEFDTDQIKQTVDPMGIPGQFVIDSRLGTGKEKRYKFGDHLLSVDELGAKRSTEITKEVKSPTEGNAPNHRVLWILSAVAAFSGLILAIADRKK